MSGGVMKDLQKNSVNNKGKNKSMKSVFCLLLCLVFSFSMTAHAVPARAAQTVLPESEAFVTFAQLNACEVFLKQSQSRVCTLTASAMMIRRAAMLSGNPAWRQITEQSVRKDAWAEKTGLKWNFTSAGITVAQKPLSSKGELIQMLGSHPEGIVIYNAKKPHAILVTDYTNGVLYCSDPSNDQPGGRYPIAQASITVESAGRCWYVKSPANLKVNNADIDDTLGTGCEPDASGTGFDAGVSGAGSDTQTDDLNAGKPSDPAEPGSGGDSDPLDGKEPDVSADENEKEPDASADENEKEPDVSADADAKELPALDSTDADKDEKADTWNQDQKETNQKSGNLMYQVLDRKAKTAVCTGRAINAAVITIPQTVQLAGVRYKVTQVAPGAFAKSYDLKEIKIGANVTHIGEKAFYQCKKLQKVTLYAEKLQTIGKDAFAKIHKKVKLWMIGEQVEKFAKLLTGTSVPVTATVKVQADSSAKAEAKRISKKG